MHKKHVLMYILFRTAVKQVVLLNRSNTVEEGMTGCELSTGSHVVDKKLIHFTSDMKDRRHLLNYRIIELYGNVS